MAYNATYTDTDLSPVVIDFLVTIGATLVSLSVIVVIVVLIRFISGKRLF